MKKILALLAIASLFSGCIKNNPDPSWLEITAWSLEANPNSQYPTGELTQNFTNAWVYVNDQPVGVFELPVRLPLLVDGDAKVTLFPAVLNNGISATKKIYPFVESYSTNVTLTKNATSVVNPTTRYISYTRFWIEDFEEASIKITDDASSIASLTSSGDPSIIQPFNNSKFGRISLDGTENKWVAFTDDLQLPKAAEVYLELDYHNTNSVLTGVLGIGVTGVQENPNIQLNPQAASEVKWKKIYIDLREIVSNSPNAEYFKVSFQSILDEGLTTGEVNIDNVKLVYF